MPTVVGVNGHSVNYHPPGTGASSHHHASQVSPLA
jgi:hypothetical protein